MNSKHYLSIDIDFWTKDTTAMVNALMDLMNKRGRVPIIAVMNHQQLLPHVDKSRARHLINVDYHSDLHNISTKELHCGSWVAYVKWRANGKYTWIRPEKDQSQGRCESLGARWNSFTDWRQSCSLIRSVHAFRPSKLLPNCSGIGLCMSPAFISREMEEFFKELIRLCKIPYEPGDPTERITEARVPPGLEEAHMHMCSIQP